MKRTKPSRLTAALLETADDMRRVGVMDAAAYEKITLRYTKRPSGSALVLLDVIRRKGIEGIM